MASEVTLLSFWMSLFGVRVQIALAEKGIEYEYIEDDLRPKSELLLKMNPVHKKIPVFIHNGKPISESLIILQYIDEVWNDKAPLLPQDPYKRAVARFWADFIDKKGGIFCSWKKKKKAPRQISTVQIYDCGMRLMTTQGEEQEKAKNELLENFKLLEGELGAKTYFGGDNLGFVDVALIPFYGSFYTYEMMANFSIEAECPKLVDWAKRCLRKESVSRHVPDQHKVYDMIVEFKKKNVA